MRISVITVVLNRRDKIAATLDSVLGQAWDDLEIIVVDGQSTDGTQDVLRHYGRRIDRLLIEPCSRHLSSNESRCSGSDGGMAHLHECG